MMGRGANDTDLIDINNFHMRMFSLLLLLLFFFLSFLFFSVVFIDGR